VNVELLVREADAACKGELTFQAARGQLGQLGQGHGQTPFQEVVKSGIYRNL